MKTSYAQFLMLVDFMERNGDLSKPSGGPRGREWCVKKWKELTATLNSEGNGDSRPEEKWRKVWSDLKNNTKKKWAKINHFTQGTGGGPALKLSLTDIEERVMAIIGVQAATGMDVVEVGISQAQESELYDHNSAQTETLATIEAESIQLDLEDWNAPGRSTDPIRAPPLPTIAASDNQLPHSAEDVTPQSPPPIKHNTPTPPVPSFFRPPPAKKLKKMRSTIEETAQKFLDSDSNLRNFERDRERMFFHLESERIRQRDIELQLQAQWVQILQEVLNVIKEFIRDRRNE